MVFPNLAHLSVSILIPMNRVYLSCEWENSIIHYVCGLHPRKIFRRIHRDTVSLKNHNMHIPADNIIDIQLSIICIDSSRPHMSIYEGALTFQTNSFLDGF